MSGGEFPQEILNVIRPRPSDTPGLLPDGAGGYVSRSGRVYALRDGYLDLLGRRPVADNVANLTNYLPGAGRGYEPLWRVRSLSLLTGERFPNRREVEIVSRLARVERGGRFLDLGCSAGLYTRSVGASLGSSGTVCGIDISPSMLAEAVRRSRRAGVFPAFLRADAKNLPFADRSFAGALCGGSLNEFGDPGRVLRETARVLEPGGRLAVMGILRARTPRGRRLQRFLSLGGVRFFQEEEVASLVSHSGLEPDRIETFGPVFFLGATAR